MVIPLSQIDAGQTCRVVWVASPSDMALRLRDLGFVPDEIVSCVLTGRRSGMRAYLVRGAVIGLREQNCREIFVETGSAEAAPDTGQSIAERKRR